VISKKEDKEMTTKTAAERAFELAKKTRLIHKYSDKNQPSIRERL